MRVLAREEGTTVFVSSHLLSEMELMCDTVAVIQQGRLVDVKSLHPEAGEGRERETAFEVSDPRRAAELVGAGRIEGSQLIVSADREAAAGINTKLVMAGIDVYAIQAVTRSLEDQFLELTGGKDIE
ncbi:hypothetical protein D3C74_350470 [compost metagenome]